MLLHLTTWWGRTRKRRPRGRGLRPGIERLERLRLLSGDAVLRWNAVALDAIAADYNLDAPPSQPGPTATARALAIVQIAVYDAVNCIDHAATPYLLRVRMPHRSSIDAAVAEAAHVTLLALYPEQKATFDRALADDLAAIPDGRPERLGIRAGRLAARRILSARARDGVDATVTYDQPVMPGSFQTFDGEPEALGANWGRVRPFAMDAVTHFRSPAPPALTSALYAEAYNEVKALGGDGVHTPTARTAEQTEIGLFWAYDGAPGLGTPPRLYNQIAQVIARQEGNTEAENARLFALVNIALADAGIACWETKYTFNCWRPVRGIRQLGPGGEDLDDGNPATAADPTWTPLGAPVTNGPPGTSNFTPPFPAYSSGHATFGAALFRVLTRFYERDDIAFSFTSDELNGVNRDPDGTLRPLVTRGFTSFSQAALENAQSRIYLGIHWGFDRDQGLRQGEAIADYVFHHVLGPRSRA
jgi:hypothetical protein